MGNMTELHWFYTQTINSHLMGIYILAGWNKIVPDDVDGFVSVVMVAIEPAEMMLLLDISLYDRNILLMLTSSGVWCCWSYIPFVVSIKKKKNENLLLVDVVDIVFSDLESKSIEAVSVIIISGVVVAVVVINGIVVAVIVSEVVVVSTI